MLPSRLGAESGSHLNKNKLASQNDKIELALCKIQSEHKNSAEERIAWKIRSSFAVLQMCCLKRITSFLCRKRKKTPKDMYILLIKVNKTT